MDDNDREILGEADFVLVSSSDYPNGTLIVQTVVLQLPKQLSQRSILVVIKFQEKSFVSKPHKVSVNGNVRLDVAVQFPVEQYTNEMNLSFHIYLRPRFIGSVRLIYVKSLNFFEDIVKIKEDQTPGNEEEFQLDPKNGADKEACVQLVTVFFTEAEAEQMKEFMRNERALHRNSREIVQPIPTLAVAPVYEDEKSAVESSSCTTCTLLSDSEDENEKNNFFEEKPIRCQMCDKEQAPESAFVLDCSHSFCTYCLKQHIDSELADESCLEVKCPKAVKRKSTEIASNSLVDDNNNATDQHSTVNCVVGQWVLRALLSEKRFNAYLDASLASLLPNDKCPAADCGAIMERYDDENNAQNDENSVEGFRNLHRFRCRACQTEFCDQCQTVPYHNEFTCEGFVRFQNSKKCRFCESALTSAPDASMPPALQLVCTEQQCIEYRDQSCAKTLDCGHFCNGIADESEHPPCFHCENDNGDLLGGEWCAICYVDALCAMPSIALQCGHLFHYACVLERIGAKWNGPVITFQFLDCPLCKQPLQHPALTKALKPAHKFKSSVEAKASERLAYEDLLKCDQLVNKHSRFYGRPVAYAMSRYAYYQCFQCKHAYFAGQKSCQEAHEQPHDPTELICGKCSGSTLGSPLVECQAHKSEFLEYKCQFCCSPASWFCWGKTHFCDACHTRQRSGDYLTKKPLSELPQCAGRDQCPLRLDHPPNGTKVSICLGCAVCRQSANF